jgi:hypothetical protein
VQGKIGFKRLKYYYFLMSCYGHMV